MRVSTGAHALAGQLVARLSADPKPDPDRDLPVLAALDGPDALASYVDGQGFRVGKGLLPVVKAYRGSDLARRRGAERPDL